MAKSRAIPSMRCASAFATWAKLVVRQFPNISASPFFLGKHEMRLRLLREHARRVGVPILFLNQVGGNDELLFDGCASVVDAGGELFRIARRQHGIALAPQDQRRRRDQAEPLL